MSHNEASALRRYDAKWHRGDAGCDLKYNEMPEKKQEQVTPAPV